MTRATGAVEALEAAKLAQQVPGVRVAADLRSLRMTVAMRLEDAVWAADAQVRSSEIPVVLATGLHTFGRVVDTSLSQEDRSVLHATIEVDL